MGRAGPILSDMAKAPDMHELDKRMIHLEGDMNTMRSDFKAAQSGLEGALERLRADMADWKTDMADWKTDMADWKTDMVERDKDNQRWTVGFGVAQIVLTIAVLGAGFAFLGILIGLPG